MNLEKLTKLSFEDVRPEKELDFWASLYVMSLDFAVRYRIIHLKIEIETLKDLKNMLKKEKEDIIFIESALNWIEQSKGNKGKNLDDFFNLYKDMFKHNHYLSLLDNKGGEKK